MTSTAPPLPTLTSDDSFLSDSGIPGNPPLLSQSISSTAHLTDTGSEQEANIFVLIETLITNRAFITKQLADKFPTSPQSVAGSASSLLLTADRSPIPQCTQLVPVCTTLWPWSVSVAAGRVQFARSPTFSFPPRLPTPPPPPPSSSSGGGDSKEADSTEYKNLKSRFAEADKLLKDELDRIEEMMVDSFSEKSKEALMHFRSNLDDVQQWHAFKELLLFEITEQETVTSILDDEDEKKDDMDDDDDADELEDPEGQLAETTSNLSFNTGDDHVEELNHDTITKSYERLSPRLKIKKAPKKLETKLNLAPPKKLIGEEKAIFDELNIDPTREAMLVFRVEKLKIARWPESEYGHFYSGDSYIVYKAKRTPDRRIQYQVFMWLGKDSAHDEITVCAIKATTLSKTLGSRAVLHRECQDYESPLFMSLFPNGLQYLEGGCESALRTVKSEVYEDKLFLVRGRKYVKMTQIDCKWESLNTHGVYILDTQHVIYCWQGKHANILEKAKASEVCSMYRSKRRVQLVMLDQLDPSNESMDEFLGILRGSPNCHISEEDDDEEKQQSNIRYDINLYAVEEVKSEVSTGRESQESNEIRVKMELIPKNSKGHYSRNHLRSKNVYVLDCGTEVFVWSGKEAPVRVKKEAHKLAESYLSQVQRPSWTRVCTMMESAETVSFQSKFPDWLFKDLKKLAPSPGQARNFSGKVGIVYDVDPASFHDSLQVGGVERKVNDQLEDMVVSGNDPMVYEYEKEAAYPKSLDSLNHAICQQKTYIFVFDCHKEFSKEEEKCIMFWHGRDARKENRLGWMLRGQHEFKACLKFKKSYRITSVIVDQGKEPWFFPLLFRKKYVIISRKKDHLDFKSPRLFNVKETGVNCFMVIEADNKTSALNPGDAFILASERKIFIWRGEFCSKTNAAAADAISRSIKTTQQFVYVDSKAEDVFPKFFAFLGGYPSFGTKSMLFDVRVYLRQQSKCLQCRNDGGKFVVQVIPRISQTELDVTCVYLFDLRFHVIAWFGRQSSIELRNLARRFANDYITAAPDHRDKDRCEIVEMNQGAEDWRLIRLFYGWTFAAKIFTDPQLRKSLILEEMGINGRVVERKVL